MPKPKEIFLLEVSYPEEKRKRYRHGSAGGGIFRTERDMKVRIDTIRRRQIDNRSDPIKVEIRTYKLTADWEQYDI
jgi:hypothetical protein